MIKRFKLVGGQPYPVVFKNFSVASEEIEGAKETGFIKLPEVITPDIIAFEARYVQSGPNLNKAYFDQIELVKAYHSIPYKAMDVEHELENIIGHIYASTFIDRDKKEELGLDKLQQMSEEDLRKINIDVMIGGITYIDRFPALEGPISEKRYCVSMETYFSSFDLLLSNGMRVTMEEAEILGWNSLIDQMLADHSSVEELEAAHKVKVVLADKSEVPMEVYKWLIDLSFSGGGAVLNPACKACKILSTSADGCDCDEAKGKSSEASTKTQADEMLTINLTKLDRYMESWRESSEGKKMNHQVKDNIISIHTTEEEEKAEAKETEKADDTSEPRTGPFSKDTDPNEGDKGPSVCPQYKYEIWIMHGESQERMRHWCVYANEKCPTAGDRTFHECNRWYNRDGDWIYDTRNFRGDDNPFAPSEYDPEEPPIDASTATVEYKQMSAVVDSFLYEIESKQRDREIKSNKRKK